MTLTENCNYYEELKSLIENNDGVSISSLLQGYNGELCGLEQELGCLAVKRFRRGKDPIALLVLSKVGFNLLGRDDEGRCPFEDLMSFHFHASSRKREVAETIKALLDDQYERFLPGIREQDESYASWIERAYRSVTSQKSKRRSRNLTRTICVLTFWLVSAKAGILA